MTSSITTDHFFDNFQASLPGLESIPLQRPKLNRLAQVRARLPSFVQTCPTAQRYLDLLGSLDWDSLPERDPHRAWPGPQPQPRAAYVASYLVKVEEGLRYMSDLHRFLQERPSLIWLFGFNLYPDASQIHGFDVGKSLPSSKHFGRVLRELPNACLQTLLTSSVHNLQANLPQAVNFGQSISLDTKVILAWVKENNPKTFIPESQRLDKTCQPTGDPDCKLGCKKKANQPPNEAEPEQKASHTNFGQQDVYFWGYASGLVGTKIPDWGEFVLAELTQTFDRNDVTYFFPLMKATEARLGFAPPYGALDKAFDTFYVHDYFDQAGGFAAVPFAKRGRFTFQFDETGLPLCQAGLPMPCKSTFICRTTEYDHQRGRYVCPLRYPEKLNQACPVQHKNDAKQGCITTMATSKGARLRYQLDRDSEAYKTHYKQRTATERLNAQAKELGIERPKLRNQKAIANLNTLIYVIINQRGLKRVKAKQAKLAQETSQTEAPMPTPIA